MGNSPIEDNTTTMIAAGTRSRSKPCKTTGGPCKGTATDTTKSQPIRFKFVQPNCVTANDGYPIQLGVDPSGKGVQNDLFIINTPSTTKTDPNVRRFIRSHVMRGKNKKIPNGNKHTSATSAPANQGPGHLGSSSTNTDSFVLRHSFLTKNPGTSAGSSSSGTRQVFFPQWIPKAVGSSLPFVRFAEPLPQSKVKMLITALASWGEQMYPLSMCVGLQVTDKWIEYLSKDQAFVNSMLFAAKCTANAMENRGLGREATVYLSKTLKFLQSNLNDKEMATTDTSITVVVILILAACGMGDTDEVGHHIGGMRHMIKLRGGVSQLDHAQMIQMKVCRVDLSYALEKGEDSTLFTLDEIEGFWDKVPIAVELREANKKCPKVKGVRKTDAESRQRRWSTNPSGDLARGAAIIPALWHAVHHEFLPHPNFLGRLTSIFDDLHEFSDACNLSLRTGIRVPADRFRDTLISTQYRLLKLEAKHTKDINEGSIPRSPLEIDIIRVGMLVFGIVTFLHIEAVVFRYCHVADKVRTCLRSLSATLPDILQHHSIVMQDPRSAAARVSLQKLHLFLWFLFIINVSTFVAPENKDLVVGLVSDIFIAIGLKSLHGGAGPAIQAADPTPPYLSRQFDMHSVPHEASYPSYFSTTTVRGTFSTTSHASNPRLDSLSFPPEYSYPPPPSSTTSADEWQPNTPPEQHPSPPYLAVNQQSTSKSGTLPYILRDQSPSRHPVSINGDRGAVNHFELHYHNEDGSSATWDVASSDHIAGTPSKSAPSKSLEILNDYATERIKVYKSHVSSHYNRPHQRDPPKDDSPLLYVWDILKDHLWVDWLHKASGEVLAYKAFALGFGGYPLRQPGLGYPGEY